MQNQHYCIQSVLPARYLNGAQKFVNYFRMSPGTFSFLVKRLTDYIQKSDTIMRVSVPPREMLAVA